MERTFEVEGPVEADVRVPAGLVEVTPAEGGTVTVSLEADGTRRGEELVAASEVSFEHGRLRVHVPERTLRNVAVRCRLRLPARSALTSRTVSADVQSPVSLRAFDGSTASGDTKLHEVSGEARSKSASGDFTCGSVGSLHLTSASGDVAVEHALGDVMVHVASGDVHLHDAGASVEVHSASGDVRLDRVRSGRVVAQTASGDVLVGVAAGVGAYLDLTTVSGETNCTLPFREDRAQGPGELQLAVRTVSGDIVVRGAGR